METKDIIGKEFRCFKFENRKNLRFDETYHDMVGLSAVVSNIHATFDQYAACKVTLRNGNIEQYHYPIDLIKEQLEANEPAVDIDILIEQIKNLTQHYESRRTTRRS